MNRFTQIQEIQDDGIDLLIVAGFIPALEAREHLQALMTEAAWHRPEMRFMGQVRHTRRLVAWHADPRFTYRYSGQEHSWEPWSPAMTAIRAQVEEFLKIQFNGVLLNLYADGDEYVSPHADDERDMEHGIPIAAVSLGATRDFVVRHANGNRHVVPLENGSLVVMRGRTQEVSKHSIPKRSGVSEPRISLTFRRSTRQA